MSPIPVYPVKQDIAIALGRLMMHPKCLWKDAELDTFRQYKSLEDEKSTEATSKPLMLPE